MQIIKTNSETIHICHEWSLCADESVIYMKRNIRIKKANQIYVYLNLPMNIH